MMSRSTKMSAIIFRVLLFCVISVPGIFLIIGSGGGGGEGDGSGGPTNCDTPLTVDYVNNEFSTKDIFVLGGYTASGTTLIHADGNQGNSFDIDSIILSRTSHSSGNSLALSYSIYATTSPSSSTFIAFYIDTDNDQSTGEVIGNIGADVLILDGASIFGVMSDPFYSSYYDWSGANDWTAHSSSSSATYFQGCTLSVGVYAPIVSDFADLYGQDVRGIMRIIELADADPDSITNVIDSTSEFNFIAP